MKSKAMIVVRPPLFETPEEIIQWAIDNNYPTDELKMFMGPDGLIRSSLRKFE